MKISAHIEVFRRLDRGLAPLESDDDFALWAWGAQNALTHLYNAALHAGGFTREDALFPCQMVGVFADETGQRRLDGQDVLHGYLPDLDVSADPELDDAKQKLCAFEAFAAPLCRTGLEPPEGDLAGWRDRYGEIATAFIDYLTERTGATP